MIQLAKPAKLKTIRLHWEEAVATKYVVSVSRNGRKFTPVDTRFHQTKGPAVDVIKLDDIPAAYIRLDLLSRFKPEWGLSWYEIEVLGTHDGP